MANEIVIFVFGMAVAMVVGFSAFIALIARDHPDEPKKKS
jgi:hypothetical protein